MRLISGMMHEPARPRFLATPMSAGARREAVEEPMA
jgi:hypothetical protein